MDHRGDAPSWLPGTGAVSTGVDPPDLDASDDEQQEGGPVYAAGPDDNDAPGFSDPVWRDGEAGQDSYQNGDVPAGSAPNFGDASAPGFASGGFGERSAYGDTSGYGSGQGEPSAFGDAPAFGGAAESGYDAYGPAQGAEAYSNPGPAPASSSRFTSGTDDPGQAYNEAQSHGFADSQGYSYGSQRSQSQGQYTGPVTGEFRGDYDSGYTGAPDAGYGPTQGGFGSTADPGLGMPAVDYGAGPKAPSPAMGSMYGDQGYQAGQENGARPMDQPGYPSQYRSAEPPKARMTASLRAVKRRGLGTAKRNVRGDQGRQAQLTVSRVEPWSVMKFSFVISLVAFIVFFVAIAVLYAALSGLGVFSALQHSVANITSSQGSSGFNLMTYLSASRVLGYTGLLGAINVVLITALCTVGSVLYNLSANLAGGVEITLKESD